MNAWTFGWTVFNPLLLGRVLPLAFRGVIDNVARRPSLTARLWTTQDVPGLPGHEWIPPQVPGSIFKTDPAANFPYGINVVPDRP